MSHCTHCTHRTHCSAGAIGAAAAAGAASAACAASAAGAVIILTTLCGGRKKSRVLLVLYARLPFNSPAASATDTVAGLDQGMLQL